MAESGTIRTIGGKAPRVPVTFYVELDRYVEMCKQVSRAGMTLSSWLREAAQRELERRQKGPGHDIAD